MSNNILRGHSARFTVLLVFLSVLLVLGTSYFLHFLHVHAKEDDGIDIDLTAYDSVAVVEKRSNYDLPSDSGNTVLLHSYTSDNDPMCEECGYIRFVDISGLDTPITGLALDNSITLPVSSFCNCSVVWSPNDQIAQASTVYTATVTITPTNGAFFRDLTIVKIDGVVWDYSLSFEGVITVTKTFPMTSNTPGVNPNPGTNPDPGTTPDPIKEPSFEDFIERMYVVALNRDSEPEGKAFWMDKVLNDGFTGGRVAIGFLIEAPEFLNRNLKDDEFIDVLYKTFFDRAADADGKAFWKGHLATDMTREQVVRGFIDSIEWCNLCAYYGVKSGAPNAKAEKPSNNAIKFATRLYTECLGRDPEDEGLMFWALRLTNLESSGAEAAKGFFESKEFKNLNLDDTQYLTRLYKTFMGREPDDGGMSFWLGHLSTDMNRAQVLKGFAESQEFANICKQYGIDQGTI